MSGTVLSREKRLNFYYVFMGLWVLFLLYSRLTKLSNSVFSVLLDLETEQISRNVIKHYKRSFRGSFNNVIHSICKQIKYNLQII